MHRYELDVEALMAALESLLQDRGYRTVDRGPDGRWIFETRWGRGAAYGEIGSAIYGLIADRLQELD